ncbi:MAG: hypothetical protein L0I76_09165 [Pseudonocardia sp.]|nr:hypothetical protein [Pseudonocardia sp.]
MRRPLLARALVLLGVALALASCSAQIVTTDRADPPTAAGPPAGPPVVAPDTFRDGVQVSRAGEDGLWLSWAVVDTVDGRRNGSANAATDRTNAESAIKAWIAADHLRVARDAGDTVTAAERDLIRRALRNSDDPAAERLYRGLGGDRVLAHLDAVCGVEVSTSRRGYWSYAQITAVDATRILTCVRDRAPTYPGGAALVADLHNVDEGGSFGIRELLGGDTPVAEKNGWTLHPDTGWNVNCVVAWDRYALAVMTRFPAERPESYGWGVCRDVTEDVLASLPG